VLAIKQTLYRTTPDSPLVESLVSAAKAGKEVTVLIELRARFDEAANIELASKLQEAGAHVVYGVVGYKTHCKMALVVRREAGKLKRYVHLGTGNYHPRTARAYTDYGLLSANEALGEDVHQVFMQLTSLMRTPALNLLSQSPFNLHDRLVGLIKRETQHASSGGTGHIIAKLNALVEPEVIRALYEASGAGVFIDLIVRGICCLRPGASGPGRNITVRSIVDRFLEHSRVFYFHNAGDPQVYVGSADWMDRNLSRRVEVVFPVEPPELKNRLIREVLATSLADNVKARELLPDGSYRRVVAEAGQPAVRSQERFLELAAQNALRLIKESAPEPPPLLTMPRARGRRKRQSNKAETTPR
jgi:polyphosphate kinase